MWPLSINLPFVVRNNRSFILGCLGEYYNMTNMLMTRYLHFVVVDVVVLHIYTDGFFVCLALC